ncbi:MAG: type ISP restriction/modification enzyme [Armatimonadota bacterium]|nr:type ISP restriction/modification enzyme [Armatimonadota bacterium]
MAPASSDYDRIKGIRDFESLVAYLRDDLEWPIQTGDFQESDVAFDYSAEELSLDEASRVKFKSIKQLRPLVAGQPWGVFYIEFESKRLPVVVMRKILRGLVARKRGGSASQPTWNMPDLLFISATGEEDRRGITFAHFRDNEHGQPVLQTFSWDERETHFFYLQNMNMNALRWPDDPDPQHWRQQWSGAFTTAHRQTIATAKDLSVQLAQCAKSIRVAVLGSYSFEAKSGPLHKLYESFKTVLIHDLDADRFADMVAQTITYGLFSARATGEEVLGLHHLEAMIPNTNPFLKELFAEFTKLSGQGRGRIDFDELGISALVEMLNSPDTDMESVLRDFDRQTGGGQEDPVIHFYESFLREYDREQKVKRGVFYTPKPVVSFIVRSVDGILREDFNLPDGLADTTTWGEMAARKDGITIPPGVSEDSPFVQILDPACGTGTFLVEVIDVIHETMTGKWREGGADPQEVWRLWNDYVPRGLLPRLYGFELMMAPYAIAHLKIGLKLRETGYDFRKAVRLQVYLTNTLEEPTDFSGQLIPDFLSHEALLANRVKRDAPVTGIVGNPPYSALSANLTPQARRLVDRYRSVAGVPIRERSMLQFEKNIQDDYIKFLSVAQRGAEGVPVCVIGMVTNHSYLDGPTLRGVRWSLLQTFCHVDILDLHGSANKRETEANSDENVFDIQQGVAISLLTRDARQRDCHCTSAHLRGTRADKYAFLMANTYCSQDRRAFKPSADCYYFIAFESGLEAEYDTLSPMAQMLPKNLTGTTTGFDDLLLDFERSELERKVVGFASPATPTDLLSSLYDLDHGHAAHVLKLRGSIDPAGVRGLVRPFQLFPFDMRWGYLRKDILQGHRFDVMENLGSGSPGLIAMRQTKESFGVFATAGFCGHKILASYDRSYVFPLYLCNGAGLTGSSERSRDHLFDTQEHLPFSSDGRAPNLSAQFRTEMAGKLGVSWVQLGRGDLARTVGPEDAFNYVYAVLHSPGYRSRYAEFLKIDFPRIPLTTDLGLFRSLCKLGRELVALHLMEQHAPLITTFQGNGDSIVEKPRYTEPGQGSPQGRVWINNAQYFEGVPPEVWRFHIGGYQVCEKWLKDRGPRKGKPGRKLSDEDILHYQRVVAALKETIRLMAEIDEVIEEHGGWPLVGSVGEEAKT